MFVSRFAATATLLIAALAITSSAESATADSLGVPTGPVILTVSGDIANTNGDGVATFDVEMLRELGETDVITETIWTPKEHRFTGVRLKTLLEHVGADGKTIKATAINDYAVEIPAEDATAEGPIVAYEMDGQLMSRRDKGPLWIIYPYSSSSDYRTEVIYSRSIWQLDRMIIAK